MVTSARSDNRFGHPDPEVLQQAVDVGAALLRTDELGTIKLIGDGKSLWWQTKDR